jgi:heme-degrading monooxygenase HmoA
MTDQVKQAFQQRPHQVDNATGFVRMEVLSPCDAPNEIWLFTYWNDEASYRTWHRSHLYQECPSGKAA